MRLAFNSFRNDSFDSSKFDTFGDAKSKPRFHVKQFFDSVLNGDDIRSFCG